MIMRSMKRVCIGVIVLTAVRLWAQGGSSTTPAPAVSASFDNANNAAATDNNDTMQTPPPVSGQAYASVVGSAERSNYLRGGVTISSAYTDNAVGAVNGYPVSDISTSITPSLSLDEVRSRLSSTLTYATGFTFYQRETERNEADQTASLRLQYRLSPHVILSGNDSFQKSSNVFNQPDLSTVTTVSGGIQQANFSVIAPIADVLRNSGNAGISYQFALNQMIGATGTFSTIHYPNSAEVPGLYDSSSQGGSFFYSWRVSPRSQLGATYQYQRMVSSPGGGVDETQTHAVMLFYSLQLPSRFSVSFFGGPQYSDTVQPPLAPLMISIPPAKSWTPAVGGSFGWQGKLTRAAFSYSHVISGGGGLVGAVHLDSASASFGRQIHKTINASVSGMYAQNSVLGGALPGENSGHTVSASAALQKQFLQHISVQLGYTRLHQDYSDVPVISSTPNTNRESISISYQFSRPLGR
jgi:hypothetical protein